MYTFGIVTLLFHTFSFVCNDKLSTLGLHRSSWQLPCTCGPNCLFALLRFHQINVDHDKLVRRTLTGNPKGVSLKQLCDEAQLNGLPLVAIHSVPSQLDYVPLPCIAHLAQGYADHYVLITHVTKEHIEVIDGSWGSTVRWHRSRFEQQWSGYLLIVEHVSDIIFDYCMFTLAVILFLAISRLACLKWERK